MLDVTSVGYVPSTFSFEKVNEIPGFCTQIARKLKERPLFNGVNPVTKKCKVIAMANSDDARICDIFSRNTEEILGCSSAWYISEYGHGNFQLWNSGGFRLPQGLALTVYDDRKMCLLETLRSAYGQVLKKMTSGWEASEIEDNSGIMFQKDPSKFALYIKNAPIKEEDVLIRFLASKFSMENDVKCHSEWLTDSRYRSSDRIYLWIKKSVFKQVADKFGFSITQVAAPS